jgi:hypothetical protein
MALALDQTLAQLRTQQRLLAMADGTGYLRRQDLGLDGVERMIRRNGRRWRHAMVGDFMDAMDRKDLKEWKARKSSSYWGRSREVRTPASSSVHPIP